MEFYQVLVSGFLTTVVYGLVFAGVLKLWTTSRDVAEIKELLRDLKRERDAEAIVSLAPGRAAMPEPDAAIFRSED